MMTEAVLEEVVGALGDDPNVDAIVAGVTPLALAIGEKGLPVFRSGDRAVKPLGKYIRGRLQAREIAQTFAAPGSSTV
jgi:hypothetical protein